MEVAIDQYVVGKGLAISTRLETSDGQGKAGPAKSIALVPGCTTTTIDLTETAPLGEVFTAAAADPEKQPLSCDLSKPFGPATFTPGISLIAENVRLSSDELTAYFVVDDGNQYDVFQAQRSEVNGQFGTAIPLPGINTDSFFVEGSPSVPDQASSIYFETNRDGRYDIYTGTWDPVAQTFLVPNVFPLDTSGNSGGPFVTADGSALYYHSEEVSGGVHIYARDLRPGASTHSVPLTSLNGSGTDTNPVTTPDQLTIVFSSSRDGTGAKNDIDMWIATRRSIDEDFDPPVPIQELNTDYVEGPTWISADGCRLYFDHQFIVDGTLAQNSFVAARPR